MGNWVLGVLMSEGGETRLRAQCWCLDVRNSAVGEFSLQIKLTFYVTQARSEDETKKADAKMREEIQEESVCLLKIQRGRTDIIALSDDLWQHWGETPVTGFKAYWMGWNRTEFDLKGESGAFSSGQIQSEGGRGGQRKRPAACCWNLQIQTFFGRVGKTCVLRRVGGANLKWNVVLVSS